MFFELQHEKIIATAIDPRAGIALGQQPDVAAIVVGPIVLEEIDLQAARLRPEQVGHHRWRNQIVANQGAARRLIAGADPQRELIDDIGAPEMIDLPSLSRAVREHQPFRHHEGDRKGVGFGFLEVVSRFGRHRHPAQDALIVEARLVSHRKMPEFVRGREALDAHRSFRRDENARSRCAEIGAEQAFQRTKQQG